MDLGFESERLWNQSFAQGVDRLSSEKFFIHPLVLMECAGHSVSEAILEVLEEDDEMPVIVLAGPGNNGGDALVAGRRLADAGLSVSFFLLAPEQPPRLSESCAAQIKTLKALGHQIESYVPGCFKAFARREPIIIDGLFGLGFRGTLAKDSLAYRALKELNQLQSDMVVAVDLPSGLQADCGERQEIPLTADLTITFGGLKPAHALSPARDMCGTVIVREIGFPTAAAVAANEQHPPVWVLPSSYDLVRQNPWDGLPASANKYDRGHVLIIGGSAGKTGAPLLAGQAALRAGAGWASIAMPASAMATLKGALPRELTFENLFTDDQLDPERLAEFLSARHVNAVAIGPGSMTTPLNSHVIKVLSEFVRKQDGFVVLDAGATQDLETLLKGHTLNSQQWLATPHPGEWRRMGPSFAEAPLLPSNCEALTKIAKHMGISLIYKNATPVLLTDTLPAFVVTEGSRALARAGSGDVLAGVAAAHGAIGLSGATAALRSQVLIAYAAKLAATELGQHAVMAHDIIERLGQVDVSLLEASDEEMDETE